MIETSKDLLYIAIGGAVVLLTFFLCWALYYIAMILKRAHLMVKEISDLIVSIKEKLERVEQLINTIEEKIKSSASYLPLVFKGITELIGYIKKKKEGKAKKKKAGEK